MKNYTKIVAVKPTRKLSCSYCGGCVNCELDHFVLEAHWKIKRKADTLTFCSVQCLSEWTKSDE